MPDRLAGKRVVVTDAAEFMGPDIVSLFREEGAEVIADTSDLCAPGRCVSLIANAGHVDVLMVNLASGNNNFSVLDTEDETLDAMFARMVRPLHQLTRAVLPQMIERRHGKIVVVGSAHEPQRLFSGADGTAWLRAFGRRGGCAARSQRACDRSDVCRESELLFPRLSGDRRIQATAARSSRWPPVDGPRSGNVPAGFGRTGDRLAIWAGFRIRRWMGSVKSNRGGFDCGSFTGHSRFHTVCKIYANVS